MLIFTDNTHYQNIASAIRAKTGTSQTYTPSQMGSAIRNISGGGGGGISIDDLATTGLTGNVYLTASKIKDYAFYYQMFSAIDAPNVSSIGGSAFQNCYNLTTVSFLSAKTIGSYAFQNCIYLTTVSFPAAISINTQAFQYNTSLTAASFPNAKKIDGYAFQNCYVLTTANFPEVTSIGSYVFQNCYSLTTVSFPACTMISNYAFQNCRSLTTANFPSAITVGSSAFYACSNLTTANFPVVTTIDNQAFRSCYTLTELHLEEVPFMPTLGMSVFISTPIGGYSSSTGKYGSVFVPASLYSAFLRATNWSSISSRIVSVS